MAHKIDKWKCSFCSSEFHKEKDCVEHESDCRMNPITQSCQTCDHYTFNNSNTFTGFNSYSRFGCKEDALPSRQNARMWCAKWKSKEGVDD